MDEKERSEVINIAINKLSELTGEDFHGYRSEIWSVLSSLISPLEFQLKEAEYQLRLVDNYLILVRKRVIELEERLKILTYDCP